MLMPRFHTEQICPQWSDQSGRPGCQARCRACGPGNPSAAGSSPPVQGHKVDGQAGGLQRVVCPAPDRSARQAGARVEACRCTGGSIGGRLALEERSSRILISIRCMMVSPGKGMGQGCRQKRTARWATMARATPPAWVPSAADGSLPRHAAPLRCRRPQAIPGQVAHDHGQPLGPCACLRRTRPDCGSPRQSPQKGSSGRNCDLGFRMSVGVRVIASSAPDFLILCSAAATRTR